MIVEVTTTCSVPILMYHAVADDPAPATRRLSVTPQALEEQLVYLLENGFTGLTFSEVAEAFRDGSALPPRPVALTFDDGYVDFVRDAWPILLRHGFASTLFVTTGWVSDSGHDAAGSPLDQIVDWAQVRDLAQSGVEIGAHSHSHPELDQLPDAVLHYELQHSLALLEDRTGTSIQSMAYPFGYSSPRVRQAVRAAGYQSAAAVNNLRANASHDPFMLPRMTIRRSTDQNTFAAVLTGGDRSVYRKDRVLTAGWASVRRTRRAAKWLLEHA